MNGLKKTLLFLSLAALFNLATVAALPWLINSYVLHRIVKLAGGYNVAMPAPRANASARTVVRPSPDLLYTVCVFDVSEHPLRITAPIQDSYASISGFASDTHNFFAINDADLASDANGKKSFDMVLSRHQLGGLPDGVHMVIAPSDKGLILFRSLITNEARLSALQKDFQSQQRCVSL